MQTTQNQPQRHLHPIIRNLFSKRGFDHNQQEEFLSWDLKSLPELTDLHDITKAAERIKKSMSYGKKSAFMEITMLMGQLPVRYFGNFLNL